MGQAWCFLIAFKLRHRLITSCAAGLYSCLALVVLLFGMLASTATAGRHVVVLLLMRTTSRLNHRELNHLMVQVTAMSLSPSAA